MSSIVIPAHNEERVLGRTLDCVLGGLDARVQVLVACNGCTDGTALVARKFAPRVEVLEIETASKVAALNAADARARGFPRVYLDADIAIRGEHLMRILARLERPGALAAEPRPRFDFEGAAVLVRWYYAVWRGLHGARPGDVGSGMYALSAAGRARFEAFPPIIADDGYVRAHFAAGEIELVNEAESVVRVPRTFADLLRVKTRSKLGAAELAQRFPVLWARKRAAGLGFGKKLVLLSPRLWPLLPFYLATQAWVASSARRRVRDLASYRWERDRSTHG